MENSNENAAWICTVSLIKKYTYCSELNSSRQEPLFPWIENDAPSIFHFATLREKTGLEATIRRAQLATLNPHLNPAEFREANPGRPHFTVPFSPNVISLEVRSVI
jgi:hypothetical protein